MHLIGDLYVVHRVVVALKAWLSGSTIEKARRGHYVRGRRGTPSSLALSTLR